MEEEKAGYETKKEKTFAEKARQQFDDFKMFMWNPQEKTFMGRGSRSWGEIGLFYLVFYSCLACFFAIMMSIFYYGTIDQNRPKYTSMVGPPALNYWPVVDEKDRNRFKDNNFINIDEDIDFQVNSIKKLITGYPLDLKNETYVNCDSGPTEENDFGRLCYFDRSNFGDYCTEANSFGYDIKDDPMPCVFLRPNRVWGFNPKPYQELDDVPNNEDLRNMWLATNGASMLVNCRGRASGDRNNIVNITYFPEGGFGLEYFPYVGSTEDGPFGDDYQRDYLMPAVAVRFHIRENVKVQIRCELSASGLRVDDLKASTEFDLKLDCKDCEPPSS